MQDSRGKKFSTSNQQWLVRFVDVRSFYFINSSNFFDIFISSCHFLPQHVNFFLFQNNLYVSFIKLNGSFAYRHGHAIVKIKILGSVREGLASLQKGWSRSWSLGSCILWLYRLHLLAGKASCRSTFSHATILEPLHFLSVWQGFSRNNRRSRSRSSAKYGLLPYDSLKKPAV
jgi:hypothetical protein